MRYRCVNCEGTERIEYATKVTEPCGKCGGWRFWFTHLNYFGKPSHEVAIDCQTDEVLSPDPCDEIRGGKHE